MLTVNTDSALAAARRWDAPGLVVRLAPLDTPGAVRRFLRRFAVTAHITMESDLWPNRILACPGPVIVLGGRLTARSAKGWARFAPLARKVLERIDYLSAQDAASLARFRDLGLREAAAGPIFDLKALYAPPDVAPGPDLVSAFSRPETWLAASTHEGEEGIVLAAHKTASQTRPDLRLILAPRHPRRGDDIAALIDREGLSFARRSENGDPSGAQVYLADTMGEMHLWYALSGVTFVAGSLTDRGGHTPYEPAAFGSAILHGPDTGNFRAAYDRLHIAGGAIEIRDAATLADALSTLRTADRQEELADRARRALVQDTDLDHLMQQIVAVLDG